MTPKVRKPLDSIHTASQPATGDGSINLEPKERLIDRGLQQCVEPFVVDHVTADRWVTLALPLRDPQPSAHSPIVRCSAR